MMAAYKLSLAVQYGINSGLIPERAQFRRWINAALQRDACITLRIVDEKEGRALNKNFCGKDRATNVLTFVHEEVGILYGDIAICSPVVEREAHDHHKDIQAHYAHLAIHAVLHLQGYDHNKVADANRMEALEAALLMKLGYADPYQAVNLPSKDGSTRE